VFSLSGIRRRRVSTVFFTIDDILNARDTACSCLLTAQIPAIDHTKCHVGLVNIAIFGGAGPFRQHDD
jgi:hypothetical protein